MNNLFMRRAGQVIAPPRCIKHHGCWYCDLLPGDEDSGNPPRTTTNLMRARDIQRMPWFSTISSEAWCRQTATQNPIQPMLNAALYVPIGQDVVVPATRKGAAIAGRALIELERCRGLAPAISIP